MHQEKSVCSLKSKILLFPKVPKLFFCPLDLHWIIWSESTIKARKMEYKDQFKPVREPIRIGTEFIPLRNAWAI